MECNEPIKYQLNNSFNKNKKHEVNFILMCCTMYMLHYSPFHNIKYGRHCPVVAN